MSRPLRIQFPGAWYHVMNRGARKQVTFQDDSDRKDFLSLLKAIHHRYQIEIHAYCLMGNHYHLMVRIKLPNLSQAMRHLNGVYTQRYNKRHNIDGPLFRGRYKAILVDAEDYLLRLSRYIHLNPVSDGFVNKPEDYPWSSYRYFTVQPSNPSWLNIDETLSRFGADLKREAYGAFVCEGIDDEVEYFFNRLRLKSILGDEVFFEKISDFYLKHNEINYEISEAKSLVKPLDIRFIFKVVASHFGVSEESIYLSRKKQNLPRCVFIYVAREKAFATLKDIAGFLGMVSYTSVSKALSKFKKEAKAKPWYFEEIAAVYCKLGLIE